MQTYRDAQIVAWIGQPSWVYDAVRTGRLPCLRVGRHIRFTKTMLETWLTEQ